MIWGSSRGVWTLQVILGFTIHGNPILDTPSWAVPSHEMVINMIEAFSPCFKSFLLEINELVTESTPEACLAVAADATIFDFCLDSVNI
jgi:hypothetical protein